MQLSEEVINHGFYSGVAPQFPTYAGVTVPLTQILLYCAAYRYKNGVIRIFELRMFTPYSPPTTTRTPSRAAPPLVPPTEAANRFAPDTSALAPLPLGPVPKPTSNTPTNAIALLGAKSLAGQHIQELTRVLAQTRMWSTAGRASWTVGPVFWTGGVGYVGFRGVAHMVGGVGSHRTCDSMRGPSLGQYELRGSHCLIRCGGCLGGCHYWRGALLGWGCQLCLACLASLVPLPATATGCQ